MHPYILPQGDGYHISETHTSRWDEHLSSKQSKRQGGLTTKKLRVVCSACNSGWMSKLETEVRPILEPILQGMSLNLAPEDQHVLSKWVALKVIVGEHSEGNTHVTPYRDRESLMKEGKVPDYFYICICSHASKHNAAWLRTSYTLSLSKNGPQPPLGNRTRNSQSIGIIVGPLFIWVLAIRHNNISSDKFVCYNKVAPIYPAQDKNIVWPTNDVLTDSQMSTIVYSIEEMKGGPNVLFGGDLPNAPHT